MDYGFFIVLGIIALLIEPWLALLVAAFYFWEISLGILAVVLGIGALIFIPIRLYEWYSDRPKKTPIYTEKQKAAAQQIIAERERLDRIKTFSKHGNKKPTQEEIIEMDHFFNTPASGLKSAGGS